MKDADSKEVLSSVCRYFATLGGKEDLRFLQFLRDEYGQKEAVDEALRAQREEKDSP